MRFDLTHGIERNTDHDEDRSTTKRLNERIVGEVEEGVKRNQVLIGDGDEDADFEFL